jgi:hypothetical protein
VELDPLDPSDPRWQQRPLVLEPAELPLDCTTQPVELLPPQRSIAAWAAFSWATAAL